jgi:hypothetical protein
MKMDDKTKAWIEKAKKVHGDRYDYSQSIYTGAKGLLNIGCKIHEVFVQSADSHKRGRGCPKCAGKNKTTEEFIKQAIAIHGTKYDYSRVVYKDKLTKINIICNTHGIFTQSPDGHLAGKGCSKCKGQNKTTEEFIKQAIAIHGTKYDYTKVIYVSAKRKIEIICSIHTVFLQTPNKHLQGNGCFKCTGKNKTTEEFIKQAVAIHGTKYDYSNTIYVKSTEKLEIGCSTHGIFWQTPNNHLVNKGCDKCSVVQYSKGAMEWIELIESFDDKKISHALNGGEHRIGKYSIDGYCKETNTCYEYHGCFWHGCTTCYNPNTINPFTNRTNGDLYQKTLDRENYIRSKGYNLVVMWEHDWNDICKWFLK